MSRPECGRAADMVQVPATFLGAGMSTYTAATAEFDQHAGLAAPRGDGGAVRYLGHGDSGGGASLGEQMTGNPENCRRLDALAAVAAAGELVAAGMAERRYGQVGVEER